MSKKISALPGASALDGTEKVEITQGGESVQTTAQAIANLGGASGISNGAASNELMKSDGTNAVASGIFSTSMGLIRRRSSSYPSNNNIFKENQSPSVVQGLTTGHTCQAVSFGANNSTYYVEATVVVTEKSGNTGGAIKIAGVFKKDNSGNVSQVGSTATIFAATEDISGSLSASFTVSSTNLQVVVTNASMTCNVVCSFEVDGVTNQASL